MNIKTAASAAALGAVCAAGFFTAENNRISVTSCTVRSERLKNTDLKILHVSDFHNKLFPDGGRTLFAKVKELSPDLVFITGDLIDKRRTRAQDLPRALSFARALAQTASVYYIPGNHEAVSPVYPILRAELKNLGFNILENSSLTLPGTDITVSGVLDPAFYGGDDLEFYENTYKTLSEADGGFKILLSHRPDKLSQYSSCGADLVFCGHAHGGQVRLPFVGGLYAPHQGVLPKFTAGLYTENETVMTVSRGIGNSLGPVRVFNPPHLSIVNLQSL